MDGAERVEDKDEMTSDNHSILGEVDGLLHPSKISSLCMPIIQLVRRLSLCMVVQPTLPPPPLLKLARVQHIDRMLTTVAAEVVSHSEHAHDQSAVDREVHERDTAGVAAAAGAGIKSGRGNAARADHLHHEGDEVAVHHRMKINSTKSQHGAKSQKCLGMPWQHHACILLPATICWKLSAECSNFDCNSVVNYCLQCHRVV